MRIGFLHTAEVHVGTFERLVRERAPGAHLVHVVDESLLADARARGGVDPDLHARILARLAEAGDGVEALVCTCSTISGDAEAAAAGLGMPVVRVDRPMAERAVAAGSRIAVIAAVESTVAPTVALLEDVAEKTGRTPEIEPCLVPGAWELFEAGDMSGYHDAVARAVEAVRSDSDAVVLAQASMAAVAARFEGNPPVLSSPVLAVEAALALAARRAAGQTSRQ
ncbi:MAG: aspartate/glutamate racemase family protein [Dehalococcoidia bacterium]